MDQPPRPSNEPIINRRMQTGILVQTVAITIVTLIAYYIGLQLYRQDFGVAQTMAFVTLSFSELLRAFTARSERYPILKIGVFSNRNMNIAVISSFFLLLVVIYIPFLAQVFSTVPLGWEQWRYILPLLLVPAFAAEATKYVMGWRRQRARNQV